MKVYCGARFSSGKAFLSYARFTLFLKHTHTPSCSLCLSLSNIYVAHPTCLYWPCAPLPRTLMRHIRTCKLTESRLVQFRKARCFQPVSHTRQQLSVIVGSKRLGRTPRPLRSTVLTKGTFRPPPLLHDGIVSLLITFGRLRPELALPPIPHPVMACASSAGER